MRHRLKLFATLLSVLLAGAALPALTQELSLPERGSARPETTKGVPHLQIGVRADRDLTNALLRSVAEFPGVKLGPTRISLPGAMGFQLDADVALANPRAIVGGREFAHVHPDGSLHASLDPDIARRAIEAGWAIAHPWANRRAGWDGFVMIYTPTTREELAVVIALVESSYTYITGRSLP